MRAYLLVLCLASASLIGCEKEPEVDPNRLKTLIKEDIKVGTGPAAQEGDHVWMRYKGTFKNGKEFDSNTGKGKPLLHFRLGDGSMIRGWDQGIPGMKVGGKRKLSVPSDLAYGPKGSSSMPPNTDLYFDVELVKILGKDDANQFSVRILKEGSGRAVKDSDTVTIEYDAKTMEGDEIDSSRKQGGPISFKIGNNELMASGLEDAIIGMKVGEKRRIEMPPGYGMPVGVAGISQATIQIFEVTLKAIK